MEKETTAPPPGRWINRTVVGIILATFFSDFSHEMSTAALPYLLAFLGFGSAALGRIEGVADFLVSLSKLGGGILGHRIQRKKPWTVAGYFVTTICTASIGLVNSVGAILSLRTAAWVGRGFRSPLRDYLLSDAVEKTHYGRAYGLERAGDMLGAVAGPMMFILLVWFGIAYQTVILWTIVPGVLAACSLLFLARERRSAVAPILDPGAAAAPRLRFPRIYWLLLVGVFFFGMGDFSRTFLIYLAKTALQEPNAPVAGTFSIAVLLYAFHNLVSAATAYPVGHLGDRRGKLPILIAGYAIGIGTNLLLAAGSDTMTILVPAIFTSAVYYAIEETLEKATIAERLPRELRSLGFGILACANAVGDMASSIYVGELLDRGYATLAFGIAASFGALAVIWLSGVILMTRSQN